jgi:hypothetical protein
VSDMRRHYTTVVLVWIATLAALYIFQQVFTH